MKRGFLNSAKGKKAIQKDAPATETANPAKKHSKVEPKLTAKERVYEDERIVYAILPTGQPEQFLEKAPKYRIDYDLDELVCTTLPAIPRGATLADHPDGWTECLISGAIKRKIYETPGFPKQLTQPEEVSFRLGESTVDGLGLFATRDLTMGDLIFSERPIIIQPVFERMASVWSDNLPQHTLAALHKKEWEKTLQQSFRRLIPEKEAAFWNLKNSWSSNVDRKEGIFLTNAFRTPGMEDEVEKDGGAYRAVGDTMSRINHSCQPNVERYWDTASFSFQLRATRNIAPGEEFFISYCDILKPHAARQSHLNGYKFKCKCPSCLDPVKSDARRAQYPQKLVTEEKFAEWATKRLDLPDDFIIKLCQAQIRLLEEDGLEYTPWYENHLIKIYLAYMALGDRVNAQVWGRKVGRWKLTRDGPGGADRYEKDETYGKDHSFWQMRLLAKVKAVKAKLTKSGKA
ncbi:hypothetical protein Moror_8304 [Moniliophthora roreri MCA 2997]|uniref:SET domain-containing protein n=1 Tax=Moniliophthora roreri (strain MCA 2997) TaxID=1381753 RepID=V2X511_MONRO|nr:hypothetical protein Moror_8304 [Moniliophthora roreri MCA 2997]